MHSLPNHEEHCQHTLKLYGVRADEIHTWIDELSYSFRSSHREFRHDSETAILAGKRFGSAYEEPARKLGISGSRLIEVVLDHISLDHHEEVERREQERELPPPPPPTLDCVREILRKHLDSVTTYRDSEGDFLLGGKIICLSYGSCVTVSVKYTITAGLRLFKISKSKFWRSSEDVTEIYKDDNDVESFIKKIDDDIKKSC